MTDGAAEELRRKQQSALGLIARHAAGDWGDVCAADAKANEAAVAHEGDANRRQRVLSVYRTAAGTKLYVITEWDRSATTVLLASEY